MPTTDTAKIFSTGRSQAVRLPMKYRFDCKEVYIRRDPTTGDIVLSPHPDSWDGFFALYESTKIPSDFMTEADRNQGQLSRDPFEDEEI
jgi:antitoxin VapB